MSGDGVIDTVEELVAHSLAIETEAAERYEDLADQMEVHNNPEVAALFRKLAEIEGKHVAKVEDMGRGRTLPHIPPWEYKWGAGESPEAPQDAEVHYLMSPHQALVFALAGEERAAEFFARVAAEASDETVRAMARELHDEERQHVELVKRWMERYPPPESGWDEDPDPPVMPE